MPNRRLFLIIFLFLILNIIGVYSQNVNVALPLTSGEPGDSVCIPISVDDLTNLNVYAYQTIINFDPNVLEFIDCQQNTCVTSPWGPPTFNCIAGTLNVGGYGTVALVGTGNLIFIQFKVIGNDGEYSPLTFKNFLFNSGSPVAITNDGLFNIVTDIFEFKYRNEIPDKYILYPNFPNPFNASTQITFGIPETANVSLNIYNLFGQKIVTLVNNKLKAGFHKTTWNAQNISSGIYIGQLCTKNLRKAQKLILLK